MKTFLESGIFNVFV